MYYLMNEVDNRWLGLWTDLKVVRIERRKMLNIEFESDVFCLLEITRVKPYKKDLDLNHMSVLLEKYNSSKTF